MGEQQKISRRSFLRATALALGSVLLASCQKPSTPTPPSPEPPPTHPPTTKLSPIPTPTSTPIPQQTSEPIFGQTPESDIDHTKELIQFLKEEPIRTLTPDEVSKIIDTQQSEELMVKPSDFSVFYGGRVLFRGSSSSISFREDGRNHFYPSQGLIAMAPNGKIFTIEATVAQLIDDNVTFEALTGKSDVSKTVNDRLRLGPIDYVKRVMQKAKAKKGLFELKKPFSLPINFGNNPTQEEIDQTIMYGGYAVFLGTVMDSNKLSANIYRLATIPVSTQLSHALDSSYIKGTATSSNARAVLYYISWP